MGLNASLLDSTHKVVGLGAKPPNGSRARLTPSGGRVKCHTPRCLTANGTLTLDFYRQAQGINPTFTTEHNFKSRSPTG